MAQNLNNLVEINILPNNTGCPYFGTPPQGPVQTQGNNQCYYNPSIFATATQAQMDPWLGNFNVADNPDLNLPPVYQALTGFCFQKTTENCPQNDITGSGMTACAIYSTTSFSGGICRESFGITADYDPQDLDTLFNTYCSRNKTEDCDCVMPQPADVYNLLNNESIGIGPKQCWWIPCKSRSGNYMIPSENQDFSQCPNNITICDTIVNFVDDQIANGASINVNIVDNVTGCGISGPSFLLFFEKYWWIFLIIFLIISFLVILFYFKRPNIVPLKSVNKY